jgi:hypothetical protein
MFATGSTISGCATGAACTATAFVLALLRALAPFAGAFALAAGFAAFVSLLEVLVVFFFSAMPNWGWLARGSNQNESWGKFRAGNQINLYAVLCTIRRKPNQIFMQPWLLFDDYTLRMFIQFERGVSALWGGIARS